MQRHMLTKSPTQIREEWQEKLDKVEHRIKYCTNERALSILQDELDLCAAMVRTYDKLVNLPMQRKLL